MRRVDELTPDLDISVEEWEELYGEYTMLMRIYAPWVTPFKPTEDWLTQYMHVKRIHEHN